MATENFTPSAQQNEQLSSTEDVQIEVSTPEVETQPQSVEAEPLSINDEPIEEILTESQQEEDDTFAGKSKAELVEFMARVLETEPVQSLRRTVEAIKIAFYKLHRSEVEEQRKAFALSAESPEAAAEFTPAIDELELRLKDLFKEYRTKRDEYISNAEAIKEANLKIKLQIIEELKELVESDETLNHTFPKFRELQNRWKETGNVPVADMKDIWERYHLHTEHFYNFIKINKELRDLDLKKNLEQKVILCQQAEALKEESSVIEAFRKLQKLHDSWREIGPVANELKEEIWARFKEASSTINKLHQEYFEQIKGDQVKNLELKEALCLRAEELLSRGCTSHKEWGKASDKLLEIQKEWKSIGFAPKKDNNRIYDKFRAACDSFFEAKRQFYVSQKGEMEQNLALKIQICERAEALVNSEDWKATTDQIIALQGEWKSVGGVSQRYSDQVWKRFRAACDGFFEKKSAHFSSQDSAQEENLKAKEALLAEMESCDIVAAGGFDAIKAFQRRFSEIGFVPIKQKDAIAKRYKEVVDGLFTTLRGQERDRSMNKFKERVSTMKGSGDGRTRGERDRLMLKIKQLDGEIALLENNIGFFGKSKGAEALIADVMRKIEKARQERVDTIAKVKILDKAAE
ncbi:MAG: DUF349 domain-containing protein [Rikenellaceae bacterium]